MRVYQRIRIDSFKDKTVRKEMQKVDTYLRQLTVQQARTPSLPQGTPPAGGGGGTAIDLNQFLYLPGRSAGQHSKQRVTFQAKPVTAGGSTQNPTQNALGFRALGTTDGQIDVNINIEEGATSRPKTPTREWVFPAFNLLTQGATVGLHYFVDESDYQKLTKKTFDACIYQTSDAAGNGFIQDISAVRSGTGVGVPTFNVLISGSFPTTTWPYTSAAPVDGNQPIIYMPALDYSGTSVLGNAATRDKTHAFGIIKVKTPSGATPFEDGGFIYGGGTRRELYSMLTSSGGLLTPTAGSQPRWYPAVTGLTGTFTTSSPTITGIASTTGIYSGQRIRLTDFTNTNLAEDVMVYTVDSGTQITMTENWTGGNGAQGFYTFGPIWASPAVYSQFADDVFRIYGSVDSTKKLGFEVDTNITSGQTRIMTVPDVDATLIVSQGATGLAQIIGTNAHSHSGIGSNEESSLAIEGVVLMGNNIGSDAFAASTALQIKHSLANGGNGIHFVPDTSLLSGAASGNIRMFFIQSSGTAGYTSGTLTGVYGLNFLQSGGWGSATVTNHAAALLQTGVNGTITNNSALKILQQGGSTSGSSDSFGGLLVEVSNRSTDLSGASDILYGIRISKDAASGYDAGVAQAIGIEYRDTFAADVDVVNWTGFKMPAVTGPTGTIKAFDIGNLPSTFAGKIAVGSTSLPSHYLQIGAGTTAIAPLVLTSGTSLTSPVAGAIEFTTDDFFATITTGPARKAFVLDDGTRLTAGRVPFATTNGRLTDDADMTFATDTLTVTKIAAHQITGDVQFTGNGVGLPYGSCWGNEIAWTQAVAATATWYLVSDTDMSDGELNNVTHDGSGKLTVTIAGRYLVNYGVDVGVDAANTHVVSGIAVNGTTVNAGQQHFHNMAINVESTLSSTAILSLAANDTVEVAVKHEAAGNQALSVDHLNISVVQVGG